MTAVFKKELGTYFRSPMGYVFCAVYLFFSALYFEVILGYGVSAYFSELYSGMLSIVLLLLPVLTMRLFSEERHRKTDQVLLTSPVSIGSVVLGKFFAAFIVYAACVLFTLIYALVFALFATPPWALIFGNIIGSLFFGGALIALGMFISSMTESQVVAAIITFTLGAVFILLDVIPSVTNNKYIISFVSQISFVGRYTPFTLGLLDFSGLVFFLSICAAFIFLTARVIERRRWH